MYNEYILLAIAVLICGTSLRIILGPTIWDRLLGLNLFTSKVIMLIVLFALMREKSYLLDIALVYTLLGFISIVVIAKFIQEKGKI